MVMPGDLSLIHILNVRLQRKLPVNEWPVLLVKVRKWGEVKVRLPVSYTHLDVYKRQNYNGPKVAKFLVG